MDSLIDESSDKDDESKQQKEPPKPTDLEILKLTQKSWLFSSPLSQNRDSRSPFYSFHEMANQSQQCCFNKFQKEQLRHREILRLELSHNIQQMQDIRQKQKEEHHRALQRTLSSWQLQDK